METQPISPPGRACCARFGVRRPALARAALLLLFLLSFNVPAAVRYVNVSSPNPTSPYLTWSTAARTIQAAVDAATAGDQILVTNGVYKSGGQEVSGTSNRVV